MQTLLDDPVVQAAIAPFLAAVLLGAALLRTRLAWVAVSTALITAIGLSTGLGVTPLTASRKVLLLVSAAPFIGGALDWLPKPPRLTPPILGVLSGVASVWVFWSAFRQVDSPQMVPMAAGVAVFVGLMVSLALRLREDGSAGGGTTFALGLAVGIAALLSASIGNFANGIAVAAGGAAMLLLQFALGRNLVPGYAGMLSTGLAAALLAASTFVLAQLPWVAMPLLLLVPLAARVELAKQGRTRVRLVVATLLPLAAATAPLLAAWLATRIAAP